MWRTLGIIPTNFKVKTDLTFSTLGRVLVAVAVLST